MGTPRASGHDSRPGGGLTRRGLLAGTGAAMAALAGCLSHGEDSGLSGEIVIDGSNTLFPNTALVAERFWWENNQVDISARKSGTGAGFQQFARGETDLQNASREISDDERDRCVEHGVEWIELEVVTDGLAIMKHPANDWCHCLTPDALRALWERRSTVETWRDLAEQTDAVETSNALADERDDLEPTDVDDWPDENVSLYGRDTASGTFDYFTETINGAVGNIRNDYSGTPDTNAIVRGVRGNANAVGFGGAGYYEENDDDLDLIAVHNGERCVYPEPDSIESGEYSPLSRPMYLYVRVDALEREAVREFLYYYLDNTQETAREVGFYAVPDETIDDQRMKLDEHAGGRP
ncbi:PstS family phosphate ABC transporter substrate-binding protein [Halovivax gelatinilyticus]|uniref:PstS family phosphate ABC transporter substrate-binding protein n=1 Tax=Halovivax gelatinilyticus TaxID=2961597 RepID=UPI0020CA3534|nr:PstS family phosphate ABC transporter substrate-binding protein [Halovivax gelatinilyticus]